jgi:DNA topoisomerase IB
VAPLWSFDLHALYAERECASNALAAPFTMEEVWLALRNMNRASALGLNRFGLSFYHSGWPMVW